MYKYQVIELNTGRIMGIYSTFLRAIHKADQLDLIYGAINHTVKKIEVENK